MHWTAGFRLCFISDTIGPPPVMLFVRYYAMAYPPEIEKLASFLKTLPGVEEVDADHTPLQDIDPTTLSIVDFGDLPHAAIRRTNGGLPGEALGQIFIRLSPTLQSWRTLELLSWQVRDCSRGGRAVQIRSRGLPPTCGEKIQLGCTLGIIIDFFVSGLDKNPQALLEAIADFRRQLEDSTRIYGLEWDGNDVRRKTERVAPPNGGPTKRLGSSGVSGGPPSVS